MRLLSGFFRAKLHTDYMSKSNITALLGAVLFVFAIIALKAGGSVVGAPVSAVYMHVDAPAETGLTETLHLKAGLLGQDGEPVLGAADRIFLADLFVLGGESIFPEVTLAVEELGEGLYLLEILFEEYQLDEDLYAATFGYREDSGCELFASVAFAALGTPGDGTVRYAVAQADKTAVTATGFETVSYAIRLTDQDGRAIEDAGESDFALLSAVSCGGEEVTAWLESLQVMGHGMYQAVVALDMTAVAEGEFVSLGITYNQPDGPQMPMYSIVTVSTAGESAPANPWLANPYLLGGDTNGPEVTDLEVNPIVSDGQSDVIFTGVLSDTLSGNSSIAAAECFINTPGGYGEGLTVFTADGLFDAAYEEFTVGISAAHIDALGDGEHTLYIRAQDAAGNWGELEFITFTVDTSLPRSNITAPAAGTYVRGSDYWVEGTAVKGDSGSQLEIVEVSIDYGPWLPVDHSSLNFSTWAKLVDTTTLSDGMHNVRSRARDLSGNLEIPSPGIDFYVDNTPPQTAIFGPNSGLAGSDSIAVYGMAADTNLEYYTLEYASVDTPDHWLPIEPRSYFDTSVYGGQWLENEKAHFENGLIKESVDVSAVSGRLRLGFQAGDTNLSRVALSVTESTYSSTSNRGIHATDGNTVTYWRSGSEPYPQAPQWLRIELPESTMIERVRVITAGGGMGTGYYIPGDYLIEVSETGAFAGEQIVALEVRDNTLDNRTDTFAAVKGKYVRLFVTRLTPAWRNWGWPTQIGEFEVYPRGSFATEGRYISAVYDAGSDVNWGYISWNENRPAGTRVEVRTRTGSTEEYDPEYWTDWSAVYANRKGDKIQSTSSRYIQYQVVLTTVDGNVTPAVEEVSISYNPAGILADWDVSAVHEGEYSLRLKAADTVGNSLTASIPAFVDRTEPLLVVEYPYDGAEVGRTAQIFGSAGDALLHKVEVSINGGAYELAEGIANWTYTWDTGGLENGTQHTLSVRATDVAGNIAEVGPLTVTVDREAPTVQITSPASGAIISGTATFSGTAFDVSNFEGYELSYGIGNSPSVWTVFHQSATPVNPAGVLGTLNTASINSGVTYTIRLRAYDTARNSAEARIIVVVDNEPPVANLRYTRGVNQLLINFMGERFDMVRFDRWELAYMPPGSSNFTLLNQGTNTHQGAGDVLYHQWNTFARPNGVNIIRLRAYDSAGNMTEVLQEVIVDNFAPAAVITAPAAGSTVINGASASRLVTVIGTTIDNLPGDVAWTLSYGVGETPSSWTFIADGTNQISAGQLGTWDTSGLADGVYTLRLEVSDTRHFSTTTTRTVKIDTTPPASSITYPADGGIIPGILSISGVATDVGNLTGISKVEVRIEKTDGTTVLDWTTAAGTTSWSLPWDNTLQQNLEYYRILVRATDGAGNQETAGPQVTVKVDHVAPEVLAVTPVHNSVNVAASERIRIDFSKPMNAVSIRNAFSLRDSGANELPFTSSYRVENGSYYAVLTPTQLLAPGTYQAAITRDALDIYGNRLKDAYSWQFTVMDVSARISWPAWGDYVGGQIDIWGTADAADFNRYGLRYSADGVNYSPISDEWYYQSKEYILYSHDTYADFASGSASGVSIVTPGSVELTAKEIIKTDFAVAAEKVSVDTQSQPGSVLIEASKSAGFGRPAQGVANYNNNEDVSFYIDESASGATSLDLYFSKYDTEANYDFVRIYRWINGAYETTPWLNYSGNRGAFWTSADGIRNQPIPANKIRVRFQSDGSVVRAGFWVEKYKLSGPGGPVLSLPAPSPSYIVTQYDLGSVPNDLAVETIAQIPEGTSLTAGFRTSANGTVWSAWYDNETDAPKARYLQVRHSFATTVPLSPVLEEVRVRYQTAGTGGTYLSPVIDAGSTVAWKSISGLATIPYGSSVTVRTRTGDSLSGGQVTGTWSTASPLTAGHTAITSPAGRYLQYELSFSAASLATVAVHRVEVGPSEPLAVWDTGALPDGPYYLKLVVEDNQARLAEDIILVNLDNTPPNAQITVPSHGGYAGLQTVISGTASDNVALQRVEVRIVKTADGSEIVGWTEVVGTEDWNYTWDASGPAAENGASYTIFVRAVDTQGNIQPSPDTVTVTLDKVRPLTAATFTPGAPNGQNGWYVTTPSLLLSATDNTGVEGIYFTITEQGTAIAPVNYGAYQRYTGAYPIDDGAHRVWYLARDTAGNWGLPLFTDVKADTSTPVVGLTRPVEGGFLRNETITGTFSAPVSGASIVRVRLEIGGVWGGWQSAMLSFTDGTWALPVSVFAAANGTHRIQIQLTNNAGTQVTGEPLTVTLDTENPAAALNLEPVTGTWVKSGTSVRIHGTASDVNLERWEIDLVIKNSSGTVIATHPAILTGTIPVANGDFGHYTVTAPANDLRSYDFALRVYDKAGNLTQVQWRTIHVDNTLPWATITTEAADPIYYSGTQPYSLTLAGKYSVDSGSGINRVEITADNGTTWQTATLNTEEKTWSATITLPNEEGHYSLYARAVDNAGNLQPRARSIDVFIDRTPPSVGTLVAKADNSLGGINLSWTPSGDNISGLSHYLVYRGSKTNTPIVLFYLDGQRAAGNRFYGVTGNDRSMSANTPHNYWYRAVDKAGNISPFSNVATALYDTIAPSTPTGFVATVSGDTRDIMLSWQPSSDNTGIGGYEVHRSITPGFVPGAGTLISRSELGTGVITRYLDRNLDTETTYYYRVVAYDRASPAVNRSTASVAAQATTGSGMAYPSPHGDYDQTGTTAHGFSCALCHVAHGSPGARLLVEPVESTLCYLCHEGTGSMYNVRAEFEYNPVAHPVKSSAMPDNPMHCVDCHDPHMTEGGINKLLRSRDGVGNLYTRGNEYCLSCHGDTGSPSPGGSQQAVMGSVHFSGNLPAERTSPDYSGNLARFIPPAGTGVECLLCHENHGSPYFRQTNASEEQVCFQCHGQGVVSRNGWDVWDQFKNERPGTSRHGIDKSDSVVKCTSCHGQRFVTADSLDDGLSTSNVTNPYNIKEVLSLGKSAYRIGVVSGMDDYCLACHNPDPPKRISTATTIVPYDIVFPANSITTSAYGWFRQGYQTTGVAHYDKGYTCRTCHHSHGSNYARLTLRGEDTLNYNGICLQCHGAKQADGSIVTVDGADDIRSDLEKPYAHPTLTATGLHHDEEHNYNVPVEQRHAACYDCHDPHSATKEESPQGRPISSGALRNVSGVKVFHGPAGTQPEFAFSSSVSIEYELCYKCHSGYSFGGTPPPGYRDISVEFNPNNASYHPVEGKGRNRYIKPEAFVNGWSSDSIVKCTDCHGSDENVKGPHGSVNPKILKRPYPSTRSDPNMLCYKCHSYETYYLNATKNAANTGSRWPSHGRGYDFTWVNMDHTFHCTDCHTVHGSPTLQRLGQGERVLIDLPNLKMYTICGNCHNSYFRPVTWNPEY